MTPAARGATAQADKFDPNGVLRVGFYLTVNGTTPLDPRTSPGSNTFITPLYAPLMTYSDTTNKYTPFLADSVTAVDACRKRNSC